jgi:hypothetical protein
VFLWGVGWGGGAAPPPPPAPLSSLGPSVQPAAVVVSATR